MGLSRTQPAKKTTYQEDIKYYRASDRQQRHGQNVVDLTRLQTRSPAADPESFDNTSKCTKTLLCLINFGLRCNLASCASNLSRSCVEFWKYRALSEANHRLMLFFFQVRMMLPLKPFYDADYLRWWSITSLYSTVSKHDWNQWVRITFKSNLNMTHFWDLNFEPGGGPRASIEDTDRRAALHVYNHAANNQRYREQIILEPH
jgi:hypothetical protein